MQFYTRVNLKFFSVLHESLFLNFFYIVVAEVRCALAISEEGGRGGTDRSVLLSAVHGSNALPCTPLRRAVCLAANRVQQALLLWGRESPRTNYRHGSDPSFYKEKS